MVDDFNWTCKSCDEVVMSSARVHHIRRSSIHRMEKMSFEQGELESFFTKSAEKFQRPSTLKDYYWRCNHCTKKIQYAAMKPHLESKRHEKDNLLGDFRTHFTRNELLPEFHQDVVQVQRQKDPPAPVKRGKKARVQDYYWKCNLCRDEVVYSCRKRHLSTRHASEKLPTERGGSTKYFTRSTLLPNEERGLQAYYWKCNHCSKEVVYDAMSAHLRSRIHANDINKLTSGRKVRDNFTQADFIWKENSENMDLKSQNKLHEAKRSSRKRKLETAAAVETEGEQHTEIDQVSDDEETKQRKGVQERKQRILNDVARYEAKFNCLKILFD